MGLRFGYIGRKSDGAHSEAVAMALQTLLDNKDRVMMKNSVHITCAILIVT
jgi:hypothetical protein